MTLGELAAPVRNALVGGPFGSDLVSRDYTREGVPVIRGQNMSERWVGGDFAYVSYEKAAQLAANTARPGDLIFTQRGTLGQVAMIPDTPYEKYVVSQSQMKLTPNTEIVDPLYLYYTFTSAAQLEYIRQNSIQVGVPHTNLGLLRTTPVRVPPLENQRAIAKALGNIDDKIELARRTSRTLESIAKAIFSSWFVDFDPVRVKSCGERSQSTAARFGVPTRLWSYFPDTLDAKDESEVPLGWSRAALSSVADVIMGQSPAGESYNESGDGLPLINGPVEFGAYHPKRAKWTTETTRLSKSDDLIVCVRGSTTGKTVKSDGEYCLGRGVAAIRALPGMQPFVDYAFRNDIARLLQQATGSTFPSWSGPTLKGWPVIRPPDELIYAFSDAVLPIERERGALAKESARLAEFRDELLPRLLSGSLVPELHR